MPLLFFFAVANSDLLRFAGRHPETGCKTFMAAHSRETPSSCRAARSACVHKSQRAPVVVKACRLVPLLHCSVAALQRSNAALRHRDGCTDSFSLHPKFSWSRKARKLWVSRDGSANARLCQHAWPHVRSHTTGQYNMAISTTRLHWCSGMWKKDWVEWNQPESRRAMREDWEDEVVE